MFAGAFITSATHFMVNLELIKCNRDIFAMEKQW